MGQRHLPGGRFNFDHFCGRPPLHVVLYELGSPFEGTAQNEKRHLQSRKKYFFHLAFWSSLKPPTPTKLQELLGDGEETPGTVALQANKKRRKSRFAKFIRCCTARER